MKTNNFKQESVENSNPEFAIPRKRFIYILIGFAIMVLGYILMSGGGTDDPSLFNPEIFSFRRIVLAPILIIVGIIFEIIVIIRYVKS